jgi:hypothetical protein
VYNPSLTPFDWDDSATEGDVPWAALQVTLAALYETNWTGAPTTNGSSSDDLADYLDSATSSVPLTGATLIDGAGALGDPCSLGPSVWVLAQFCTRDEVRTALGAKSADAYAWAAGNQLEHLLAGNSSANGEHHMMGFN